MLPLKASAHAQPVVPADGGRGRPSRILVHGSRCALRAARARAPKRPPKPARHAQPGYMLTSHIVRYTHAKVVTAARLASHTFVYRQNEPSLPTPTAERRRPGGAAERRTTHAASVCAGQRSAAGGEAARRQGATVGRCQWRDGGGEVAVARWRWRRGEAASGCGSEAVRRRQDREAASCGSHSGSLSCRRPRQQPRCAAACASAASCCRAGSAAPLRQPLLCRSRPTSVGRERQRSVGRRGSSHALHLTHIVALHAMHSLPACEGLHDQRSSTPVDDAQDVVDDGAHEPTSIDGEVHEDVGAARRESWAATGPWHRSLFGVFGLCSACSALCSTEQPPLPKQRLPRRFFRGGGE